MDLESHIKHLHGSEEVDYAPDELVVACLMRDARPYVKSFVEHYFSLGVKHLVFLDNGSTDGTVEALKQYENVTILHTELPFKEYKNPLRRYLVTRFGTGRWILYVDVDELFDYPYSDVVDLGSFLRYLSENSYTVVVAQMLDMFPEESLTGRTSESDESLKERHRYYDVSDITRQSYYTRGDASNTVTNEEIDLHRDGIYRTIFGHRALLTKHPLMFLDDKLRPIDPGPHWVGGGRVADISGALYHYKFIGDFRERVARAVEEESYVNDSSKYKKFLETLERNPEPLVKRETAHELMHVNDLVDNQFLVISADYVARVDAEEGKSASGDAPEGGRPGRRLAEAFSRISTKARTEARVVRFLKHQVELRERRDQRRENRLVEERRRLKTELDRERRRAAFLEEKSRNLERQIHAIQASRSWRLLGRLGRIRARILGKG
jgi:hypothetical protein